MQRQDEVLGRLDWEEIALLRFRDRVARRHGLLQSLSRKKARTTKAGEDGAADTADAAPAQESLSAAYQRPLVTAQRPHSVLLDRSGAILPFHASERQTIIVEDMRQALSAYSVPRGGGPNSLAVGRSLQRSRLEVPPPENR